MTAWAGGRFVLATRNMHKVAELRRVLDAAGAGEAGLEVVGLDAFPQGSDVVESGVTFAENALLKAHAAARGTRLPAVADDSGLCVGVLGGSPGVFSARWSGRHGNDRANLELLLAQLGDVPDEHRGAWFMCAAALVMPGGEEHVRHGRLDGVLAHAPRGSGGFGYDPIFVPEGDDRTLAEYAPAEKDAISHRGRAFRALAPLIVAELGPSGASSAAARPRPSP
jgi:XTP/dITP diphosphohydrolase